MANTSYTPGTEALAWIPEEWDPNIDAAAYNKAKIYPLVTDKGKTGNQFHMGKHQNLTVTKPANTTDLSSLTFQAPTETEFTMTPGTATVPVQVNLNTIARMRDPDDMLRQSCEYALAQQADQDVGSLVTSIVTSTAGSVANPLSLAIVLEAIRKGFVAGKMAWEDSQVYGCIKGDQLDKFLTIEQITNAQWRGDGEKPVVTGVVTKAYGVLWYPTNNLPVLHSMLFVKRALAIGWNQRFTVEGQRFNLANKIIGWGDYAYGLPREEFAVDLRHN